ncbi:MauE/DoxX family redox-associated membrane protein [Staphylococcus hominis]
MQSLVVYILMLNLVSALLKLLSFNYFIANTMKIINYKIHVSLMTIALVIFVLFELLSSIIILSSSTIYFYLIIIVILLFIIATLSLVPSLVKKKNFNCGCYGSYIKSTIDKNKVIENFIYILILLIYLVWCEDSKIPIYIYLLSFVFLCIRILLLIKKGKKIK